MLFSSGFVWRSSTKEGKKKMHTKESGNGSGDQGGSAFETDVFWEGCVTVTTDAAPHYIVFRKFADSWLSSYIENSLYCCLKVRIGEFSA